NVARPAADVDHGVGHAGRRVADVPVAAGGVVEGDLVGLDALVVAGDGLEAAVGRAEVDHLRRPGAAGVHQVVEDEPLRRAGPVDGDVGEADRVVARGHR